MVVVALASFVLHIAGGGFGHEPKRDSAAILALAIGAFLSLHGYFLERYGQTIGMRLLGIRIATLDHAVPDLASILLVRFAPFNLPVLIAPLIAHGSPPLMLGLNLAFATIGLVNVLFIFGSDRRCLHDRMASTMVIRVEPNDNCDAPLLERATAGSDEEAPSQPKPMNVHRT
jgi:uncharacterized RDD family membrane protein YckC